VRVLETEDAVYAGAFQFLRAPGGIR
jgi:hypothetical protein